MGMKRDSGSTAPGVASSSTPGWRLWGNGEGAPARPSEGAVGQDFPPGSPRTTRLWPKWGCVLLPSRGAEVLRAILTLPCDLLRAVDSLWVESVGPSLAVGMGRAGGSLSLWGRTTGPRSGLAVGSALAPRGSRRQAAARARGARGHCPRRQVAFLHRAPALLPFTVQGDRAPGLRSARCVNDPNR